jgi:hypothetical protein
MRRWSTGCSSARTDSASPRYPFPVVWTTAREHPGEKGHREGSSDRDCGDVVFRFAVPRSEARHGCSGSQACRGGEGPDCEGRPGSCRERSEPARAESTRFRAWAPAPVRGSNGAGGPPGQSAGEGRSHTSAIPDGVHRLRAGRWCRKAAERHRTPGVGVRCRAFGEQR